MAGLASSSTTPTSPLSTSPTTSEHETGSFHSSECTEFTDEMHFAARRPKPESKPPLVLRCLTAGEVMEEDAGGARVLETENARSWHRAVGGGGGRRRATKRGLGFARPKKRERIGAAVKRREEGGGGGGARGGEEREGRKRMAFKAGASIALLIFGGRWGEDIHRFFRLLDHLGHIGD